PAVQAEQQLGARGGEDEAERLAEDIPASDLAGEAAGDGADEEEGDRATSASRARFRAIVCDCEDIASSADTRRGDHAVGRVRRRSALRFQVPGLVRAA